MPPQCSCNRHEDFSAGKEFKVYKISARKFRKHVVSALKERGYLAERAINLCDACASYSESVLLATSDGAASSKKLKCRQFKLSDVIQAIQSGDLDDNELELLSETIGASQVDKVFQDSIERNNDYKNDAFLQTFRPKKWLGERNKVLLSFLKGITRFTDDEGGEGKKIVSLMKCVEDIYHVRNLNFIAPLSFSANLLTYFLTGSKTICSMNCCISPASGYTGILNWLKSHSTEPTASPPNCDLITFFDNNQVLSRNWRVRFDAKAILSVITTVVHLIPDNDVNLQDVEDFCPHNWLKCYYETPNTLKSILEKDAYLDTLFRGYRLRFIQSRIDKVSKEQLLANGETNDFIDNGQFDGVKKFPIQGQYTDIPHNHPASKIETVMGEPCMTNPCSYESVSKVFDHICHQCCVGEDRKWTILGCDGLPYILGSRLIDRTFVCPNCKNVLKGEDKFLTHLQEIHAETIEKKDVGKYRKFKNIFLLPGLGHFEINMVRACFKLLWDTILIDLAKLMGFRSARALGCCKKAFDHHKSFQILEIFLFGTSDELLLPYCRQCLQKEETPSATGYFDWLKQVKNSKYNFLTEAVFTYVLAVHLFRLAIRRNNHELLHAARMKFSSLYYGLNMTQYQEIDLRDRFVREQCPQDISNYLNSHESLSESGNNSKGEGGDFILEAKNKQIKQWLPPGPPTENRWIQICRNIDKLNKIRQNVKSVLGMEKDTDQFTPREVDIGEEIVQWRKKLRCSNYLDKPNDTSQHVSLGGAVLDKDLVNFSSKCSENKTKYYRNVREGGEMGKVVKLENIFITPEERSKYHDISNQSIPDIKNIISATIGQVRDAGGDDEADRLERECATLRRKNKIDLITFYKEVIIVLEEVTGNNVRSVDVDFMHGQDDQEETPDSDIQL